MQTLELKFYNDPGHGWLEVPAELVKRLGIASQISTCSYRSRSGALLYLEEDCDAPLFLKAARAARFEVITQDEYRANCFVRDLPHYTPPAPPVPFDPASVGGAFDGFTVTSDADSGL